MSRSSTIPRAEARRAEHGHGLRVLPGELRAVGGRRPRADRRLPDVADHDPGRPIGGWHAAVGSHRAGGSTTTINVVPHTVVEANFGRVEVLAYGQRIDVDFTNLAGKVRYFAEGATSAFFDTRLALLNPARRRHGNALLPAGRQDTGHDHCGGACAHARDGQSQVDRRAGDGEFSTRVGG